MNIEEKITPQIINLDRMKSFTVTVNDKSKMMNISAEIEGIGTVICYIATFPSMEDTRIDLKAYVNMMMDAILEQVK